MTYISHSKGPWAKHKYIRIVDGEYIYPEDLTERSAKDYSSPQEQAKAGEEEEKRVAEAKKTGMNVSELLKEAGLNAKNYTEVQLERIEERLAEEKVKEEDAKKLEEKEEDEEDIPTVIKTGKKTERTISKKKKTKKEKEKEKNKDTKEDDDDIEDYKQGEKKNKYNTGSDKTVSKALVDKVAGKTSTVSSNNRKSKVSEVYETQKTRAKEQMDNAKKVIERIEQELKNITNNETLSQLKQKGKQQLTTLVKQLNNQSSSLLEQANKAGGSAKTELNKLAKDIKTVANRANNKLKELTIKKIQTSTSVTRSVSAQQAKRPPSRVRYTTSGGTGVKRKTSISHEGSMYYVSHSSGPWKKHKYIKIINGEYIYPGDMIKSAKEKTGVVVKKAQSGISGFLNKTKEGFSSYSKKVSESTDNAKKNVESLVNKGKDATKRAGEYVTNKVKEGLDYKEREKEFNSQTKNYLDKKNKSNNKKPEMFGGLKNKIDEIKNTDYRKKLNDMTSDLEYAIYNLDKNASLAKEVLSKTARNITSIGKDKLSELDETTRKQVKNVIDDLNKKYKNYNEYMKESDELSREYYRKSEILLKKSGYYDKLEDRLKNTNFIDKIFGYTYTKEMLDQIGWKAEGIPYEEIKPIKDEYHQKKKALKEKYFSDSKK